MHWVIQQNIFEEDGWKDLVGVLERLEMPHSVHKVIPFVGELLPEPEIKEDTVICIGAYSMRHIAKKNNWTPGVYDLAEQTFVVQLEHWGNLMLNHDAEVVAFKDANIEKPTFIRPIEDTKSFAGNIFSKEEFYDWKRRVVELNADYGDTVDGNTMIQLCSYKEIYSEYRFWIVGGKIITASLYKRGNKIVYSSEVDPYYYDFVENVLNIGWLPHRAFVIDVCSSAEGTKIVEINTINAS